MLTRSVEELTVNKGDVLREVAQTTSYTGMKIDGDATAFSRIFTVDEDASMLERFWRESKSFILEALKRVVDSSWEDREGNFHLQLELSLAFDRAMLPGIRDSLFSFFVMNMTAKWFSFTNKTDVGEYVERTASLVDDMRKKVFFKVKPTRPEY